MSNQLVNKSVRRVVKNGFGTLCAHCSGEGGTEEACCSKKAGLEESHYARCCSCDGKGYHLLPKWMRKMFTKNDSSDGNS